ncbi:allantoin permease, partial [Escherichia coli]|nr:allantoin permease [Escherichia coli]
AGAALATLIFFATAIYYAVFEGSVIAVAAHHQFPALDYKWAALIVVCYSVPLVFGSVQHWLDKFNGVLLPFYLLGLLAAV